MRSNLLTIAAMLMALLAAGPASAEDEADVANTEMMGDSLDPGMAEAAAEQEAMESGQQTDAEMAAATEAAVEEAAAVAVEPMSEMEGEAETGDVVTGTVVETTGPAALPPENRNVPARGMHMKQVEERYGKPVGIAPPVGDPPITRWDYPGYAVYFEYSYVIHSVPK